MKLLKHYVHVPLRRQDAQLLTEQGVQAVVPSDTNPIEHKTQLPFVNPEPNEQLRQLVELEPSQVRQLESQLSQVKVVELAN